MTGRRTVVKVLKPDLSAIVGTFAPDNVLTASCSWNFRQTGTGVLIVREDGIEAAQLMRHRDEAVHITMKSPGYPRWDGYVVHTLLEQEGPFVGRITATLVSNRKWMDRLLAAPVPTSLWSDQSASEYDTRTGPVATVVSQYIQANISRVAATGKTLPLVVAPVGDNDTSPTVTINARNQTIDDEVRASLMATGYDIVVTLWLPGDDMPPGMALTNPVYVARVVKGRERSYVNFTPERGGVTKRTINVSSPQATAVIVGGPGEATARQFDYVDSTDDLPPMTAAAQTILDRAEAFVPAPTRAAALILDRVNNGGEYTAQWTWEDSPLVVNSNAAFLLARYPGDPLNRTTAASWLNDYVNNNGGAPTLPTPPKTDAASKVLQRIKSDQPFNNDWTWVGASADVLQYGPQLAREYNGDPRNVDSASAWLLGYIGARDGQEFFSNWTWYDAPVEVGVYAQQLLVQYRAAGNTNPLDMAATISFLRSYVLSHSGPTVAAVEMYSEVFYDATDDPVSVNRIKRGQDKLKELSGSVSMVLDIEDGRPWKAGPDYDYWIGDKARATFNNISVADFIYRVTTTDNSDGFKVTSQFGDVSGNESADLRLAVLVGQLSKEVAYLKAKV